MGRSKSMNEKGKCVMKADNEQESLFEEDSSNILATGESKRERKIVDTSALISLEPPTSEDYGYYHSLFCQVGLPRSKVDGTVFERRSGESWISVQAGYLDEGKGPVQQPLPYGALPRLIMAYVSTFAVRNSTQEIPMGESAADFMSNHLGITTDGKRYKAMRIQMHALAAMRLQFGMRGRTFNGQPIQRFDAWLANTSSQRSIWPGVTQLDEEFYKSIKKSAVPLDRRALDMLKGTALGLDMYVWFAQRLYKLPRNMTLSWYALKDQFGQEYGGPNGLQNFRVEFSLKLKIVKAAYPQAKIEIVRGGIEMKPSPTPVPPKSGFIG